MIGKEASLSNLDALQDKNQVFGLMAHTGTAGTADVIRVVATKDGQLLTGGTTIVDIAEVTDFNGGTVAIGTAPVELTFTGVTQSIMITADHANGTMVYLGGSAVAQSGSAAIVSLYPGESCTLDLNDGTAPLYCVGGTTNQKVYKVGLI